MLLSNIPQRILDSYGGNHSYDGDHSFVRSSRELVGRFGSCPDDLVAEDWVRLLDIASRDSDAFNVYAGASNDSLGVDVFPYYCKPFVEDSGARQDGLFELSLDFWSHGLKRGFFSVPQGISWSVYPITGVACNLSEIKKHVNKLFDGDKHQDFRDGNFIVAVVPCDNWEVFRNLDHVGKWGTVIYNHKKNWVLYTKAGQL